MITFLSGGADASNSSACCLYQPANFSLIATFNTSQVGSAELTENLLAVYSHCGAPADFRRVPPVPRLPGDSQVAVLNALEWEGAGEQQFCSRTWASSTGIMRIQGLVPRASPSHKYRAPAHTQRWLLASFTALGFSFPM